MATTQFGADQDTYLNENAPSTSYGTTTGMRLGDSIDTASRSAHILLHFPVSDNIPAGAEITGVTLNLQFYAKDWSGVTTATSVIRKMVRTWYEHDDTYGDADWVGPSDVEEWGYEGGEKTTAPDQDTVPEDTYSWTRRSSDSYGLVTLDLGAGGIADVQEWLDTPAANYGWRVSGSAPGTASQKNAHSYRSREYSSGEYAPYLDVTYTPDSYPSVSVDDTNVTTTTTSIDDIDGLITSDGGDALTERGICYSVTNTVPTTADSKVISELGTADYIVDLTGLSDGTKYYYRAYAKNGVGTSYSEDVLDATTIDITVSSGDGGTGVKNSITGEEIEYAGGGGGAGAVAGAAGVGVYGGGNGASPTTAATAGAANTGGGGGGGFTAAGGGAGGSGIVVLKYAVADAISATPELASDVFRPSLAVHNGMLFAPYAEPGDGITTGVITKSITAASVEAGVHTHITCTGHGMVDGQVCVISASSGLAPTLDGVHIATLIDENTFSIDDVDITDGTGTATLTYNHDVGYSYTDNGYETGYIDTSASSFHTGSMIKDFKYVSITHEALPKGATISIATVIDNVRNPVSTSSWTLPDITSDMESRFTINSQGKSIYIQVKVTPDTSESISPVITGMNVVWDFERIPKHLYSLDCREGAGNGRWKEHPEDAIAFLFEHSTNELTVEDRFSGEYTGTLEEIEYSQSNYSLAEGPSGLVKILVREVS